jgi:hypothetical protein
MGESSTSLSLGVESPSTKRLNWKAKQLVVVLACVFSVLIRVFTEAQQSSMQAEATTDQAVSRHRMELESKLEDPALTENPTLSPILPQISTPSHALGPSATPIERSRSKPRKSSSSTVTTRTATTTIANTTRSASTSTSATPLSSPLVSYPWQWIHPTKTGTSFANVLYMLGCPEDYSANWTESELDYHTTHPKLGIRNASLECKQRWKHGKGYDETQGKGYDWGKTRPLRPRWWLGEHAYRNPSLPDEQLFMTLRDPVDRMISQLFFKRQTNAKTDSEIAQAILQNKRFNSTHFAHHMTSFLFPLAKQQHHSGSLESLTKKACQVVQNMAWVGFVDDFERSVCLLHSRFHFPHHPVEMMNNRPTAGRNKQINVTAVGILVRKQSTILDDGVYNCARERFHRELEQWAPHCI